MRKVYTSISGVELTFPVSIAGKAKFITFGGPRSEFKTTDEEMQKAIENSNAFKKGLIVTPGGAIANTDVKSTDEPKSYPDITDFQEAADILKKEYGVAHQSVRSPEAILKKAQELNVSFPDLK